MVFRARDTKLQREVALKLLPDHFADDHDRLARFQREGRQIVDALEAAHERTLNTQPNPGLKRYDVTPDGQRFLILSSVTSTPEQANANPITAVVNWLEELRQRLPHADISSRKPMNVTEHVTVVRPWTAALKK